jgi:hypothetical protein
VIKLDRLLCEPAGDVMRIPSDATIDETKFTNYLLVQRPWDDKSGYLRRAGFELKNWPDLRAAIRRLADAVDAVEDGSNEYGTFYRVSKECSKVRPGICKSCVSG